MPFGRATRQTLINRDAADLSGTLPGFDAQLPRSGTNMLAVIHGGAMDGLYGELGFIAGQIFPWSVAGRYAVRYAAWNGVTPKQPAPAGGTGTATGVLDGAIIEQGLTLSRNDGAEFQVTAQATIEDGTATVSLVATTPGSAGNTAAGATLTFEEVPENVGATITVNPISEGSPLGLTGGADAEQTPAMMARVQEHQQAPGQGGAASDYVGWGEAQPNVTRAWCLPQWTGPGRTGLAVVNDDDADSIFLSDDEIATVQAAVDVVRPVRGTTIVITPTPYSLDPTINLVPSNEETQNAVTAALTDLIATEGQVSGAVDPASMQTLDGGIYFSDLAEAIKTAPGVTDYFVSIIAGAAPTRRIAPPANGQLIQLGAITWD